MRIVAVSCLKDNYAYLVVAAGGEAAIVDASEAGPLRDAIRREGVTPRAIWSTHHHWDHVGANEELSRELGLEVVGHASDRGRLPGLTHAVEDGDRVRVAEIEARCLHIPGHTLGAIAYYVETAGERAVFTGDTLFCSGCGRLFEGTPAMMHHSLSRLLELPGDTRVYCGHEYTVANLRFAAHVEPANAEVAAALDRATQLRAAGRPTVGPTLDQERGYNPFLRVRSPALRSTLAIAPDADDATAFAAVRLSKDSYR